MADSGDAGGVGSSGSFSAHSSRDKAFEIFVKRTITSIQKEAWGRSKEVKEIREACQAFLNSLDQTGAWVAVMFVCCMAGRVWGPRVDSSSAVVKEEGMLLCAGS